MTEIVYGEFFISDLMHGATRVRDRANLISIGLLPPIQRGGHIKPNNDHAQVFSMVSTGIAQACSKVVVVGTHTILLVTCTDNMVVICMAAVFAKKQTIFLFIPVLTMRAAKAAVTSGPTVFWITHTTQCRFEATDFYIFNFYHQVTSR